MQNNELYHVGIKGMKWGHRNARPEVEVNKSNHRSRLEDKYRKDGMSESDAKLAATKRIKTEKAIAVVAGLTIAAAATYVAVNHHQNKVDKIIKSGQAFQNISRDSNKGVEEAFYASMNNRDNTKYRGIYGTQLGKQDVYETKIKAIRDIKIASKENAKNSFHELVKNDDEFKKSVTDHLKTIRFPSATQNAVKDQAIRDLENGKLSKKAYEAFNLSLTDHNHDGGNSAAKKFYDVMKSKGYDGIQDINDMKYSGYSAKTPTILFNGAKSLAVDSSKKLKEVDIDKAYAKGMTDLIVTKLAKDAAVKTAVAGGAVVGIKTLKKT